MGLLPSGRASLDDFATRMADDARPELERATARAWSFHLLPERGLERDDPRRPSDFLDDAALRMVEGPYDLVVVVTDVPLVSRRMVAGVASAVARVVVVSTWKLRLGSRGEPLRDVEAPAVRWNAAALLLHLLGHALGLPAGTGVMAPWTPDADRTRVPSFGDAPALRRAALRFPDRVASTANPFALAWFHLRSALRNARQTVRPLLRSRAPLLPLSLPRLTTAAVVPTLVLLFSAEIWDVGINMGSPTALWLGLATVLAAAAYVAFATDLLFPRKDRRLMTEHLAVVNVAIVLTLLVAMLGLLLMLGALVLALTVWVFPEGLIHTWPTLGDPEVTLADKVRIALFVSSIGTLTGALAGGLESRTVLHHLTLFREEA